MAVNIGDHITCRETAEEFKITETTTKYAYYCGVNVGGSGFCDLDVIYEEFEVKPNGSD